MLQHDQINPLLDTLRYDSSVQIISPKQLVDRTYLDSNFTKLRSKSYEIPNIEVTGSVKSFILLEDYVPGTLRVFTNEKLTDPGLISEDTTNSFSFFRAPTSGTRIRVLYESKSTSIARTIAGRLPLKAVSFADTLDVTLFRGAVAQGSNATQITINPLPPNSGGLELFFKSSPSTTLTIIPSAPDTVNSSGQTIIPAGEGYRYIYDSENRDFLPIATQLASEEINLLAATPIGSYVSWDVEAVQRV